MTEMFLWRGEAIFNARLTSNGPVQWFMTDGTPAGTAPVQFPPEFDTATIQRVQGLGDGLAVFATFQGTTELWLTDLTSEGTTRLQSGMLQTSPFSLGATLPNGLSFFSAAKANSTTEVWVTDRTEAGTRTLAEVTQGPRVSVPGFLPSADGRTYFPNTVVGNTMYFGGDDHLHGLELWATDGSEQGTHLVIDMTPDGASPIPLVGGPVRVYYAANTIPTGTEIWTSDGTEAGTRLALEVNPGSGSSYVSSPAPVVIGDTLISAFRGSGPGWQIWRSDGSVAGSYPLLNYVATSPYILDANATHAYFVAAETTGFANIWETDGTVEGTRVIYEFPQNRNVSNGEAVLAKSGALAGNLFQAANPGTEGGELYRLDLSTHQMTLVKDINPGSISSSPGSLTIVGDRLYFRAYEPVHGIELWTSDGTPEGTILVKDIYPGTGASVAADFSASNGRVVFTADDGIHGKEPWVTDGTPEGTFLLADLYPGVTSSQPGQLTAFNGRVLFSAATPEFGRELWATDGTTANTHLVRDINSGSSSGGLAQIVPLGGAIYFDGVDPLFGRELWRSDGTAEGTFRVADIVPGPGSSLAAASSWEAATSDRLFFNADNIASGPELWMLSPESSPDINTDGVVDVQDLTQLLSGFGACTLDLNYTRTLDLDMDDCISLQDLAILLASFGS